MERRLHSDEGKAIVLFDRDAKFVAMYASFSRPAASSLFVRVFGARGRTESRSVGSEMFAARHSTTSFPSMSSICAGWGASIWPTITPTEPTSGWRRHRRQGDGLRLARTGRAKSWPCLVSAVFIIVTPGQSRPDPADQFRPYRINLGLIHHRVPTRQGGLAKGPKAVRSESRAARRLRITPFFLPSSRGFSF